MASVTDHTTPTRAPPKRRAFTLPPKLTGVSSRTGPPRRESNVETVETLFVHNAAKIVSFSASSAAPGSGSRPSSSSSANADSEAIGTLRWASHTERTIAAGPLRIYRVQGSVAFLNSGRTLHPILAKSQCWCVDGETKFVLRIRQNNYYRIELPNTCADDRQIADGFKHVLAKVCQYELTPCPFRRGFVVEIPKSPEIVKKPWRPKHRQISSPSKNPPPSPSPARESKAVYTINENSVECADDEQHIETSDNAILISPAEDTGSDAGREKPEKPREQAAYDEVETPTRSSRIKPNVSMLERLAINHQKTRDSVAKPIPTREDLGNAGLPPNEPVDGCQSTGGIADTGIEPLDELKTPTRPKRVDSSRAVTAPPWLDLQGVNPFAESSETSRERVGDAETTSIAESTDSFYSFQDSQPPSSPSSRTSSVASLARTPDSDCEDLEVSRTRRHKRDLSCQTITPSFFGLPDSDTETPVWHGASEQPMTPSLTEGTSQASPEGFPPSPTSPATALRRRRKHRRAHSPLLSPKNLYTPRSGFADHHLTNAILQKTYSLLLGPPTQLVALMLNIAARITSGAWREGSAAYGEGGRGIPGTWDSSEDEDKSERRNSWDEDDYGIPLGKVASGLTEAEDDRGGSWEID